MLQKLFKSISQKNNKNKNTKVFVGVSGGVDSSVALGLLKEQGYDVYGVFIRTWQPEWMVCSWRDERRDAMRVCAHLNVPFMECDLQEEYKKGVADYMISEYKKGRTPNPDVMCNKEVKFGAFLDWAKKRGADFVATGHYAQKLLYKNKDREKYSLARGNDKGKDQSYFLWTLTQEQLQHILFPVGHMPKSQVRKHAQRFGLPTATKKDSQGICFLGDISMKEFLSHYIDQIPGDVLNENGDVIGSHQQGALFFTIGERKGFSVFDSYKSDNQKPLYVISKDVEANTITVGEKRNSNQVDSKSSQKIALREVNDALGIFKKGMSLDAQIRYHGQIYQVVIESVDQDKDEMSVIIDVPENESLAIGQSLVLYDGMYCVGGGVIEKLD